MVESPAVGMAAPWEALLRQARLEEKSGRMESAERAYLKALRANPGFDSLERELARFYENRGRAKEARAHLLRAIELGWPREEGEPALARLSPAGRGGEMPASVTVRSLLDRRRYAEAVAALRKAAARSPEAGEDLWPDVFSALLCARRYGEAFGLAEEMLRKSVRVPFPNGFLWPWWYGVSSRYSEGKRRFCAAELQRVRLAGRNAGFPVWFAYCRGVLLLGLQRHAEAMAEYARVKRSRSPRYSMMHHPFVMYRLMAGDAKWTIANCRALLKVVPRYWWFQCRMAEALMVDGDVPGGLREFERAAADATDAQGRTAVTTWHGAALLWAGRYREALKRLDEAESLGTKVWVHCWRGAAHLKLGERLKALEDLDAAIAADPQDLEAHLWRGEAHRLMGRTAEALHDLDRAIALDPGYTWAYFNRALAREDAGDAKGMAEDFRKIPAALVCALRRAPRAGVPPSREEMREILESGLERAGGIRRPERYLDAVWLGEP